MRIAAWATAAVLLPATLGAQENPHAFTGARILTITGGEIENGTLLVHRGKIVAVGIAVAIPPGATEHDVSGRVLMPGLVDTHSHVGQVAGADGSAPIQPEVRALDSVNVRDAGIQKAQAGGITTVNVMPGSGHLLSGQTVYLKLRDGSTVEELAIRLTGWSDRRRHEDGQRHELAQGPPFPGHARQVGGAGARAVRQGAGLPRQA